jgi:hypothetical protein
VRGDAGRSKRKNFPLKKQEEEEPEGFANMGAETAALPDLSDFEFCKIIHENPWGKLVRTCILVA